MRSGGQQRGHVLDVATIARAANARVGELARRLLPNGRVSGDRRHWETNNLDDTPSPDGGHSLKVDLVGPHIGRWRDFTTKEGGDMIDLVNVRQFGGGTHGKGQAIAWLKSWLGLDDADPARVARVQYRAARAAEASVKTADQQAEVRKRRARALWMSGVPIAGTPAEAYLMARGIEAGSDGWPGSLRFHDEVWNADAGVKLPALLSGLWTPDGAHVATHRVWIGRDASGTWVKADAATPPPPNADGSAVKWIRRGDAKKVLGRARGAFVPIAKGASGKSIGKLADDAAETVHVTEGVEDALVLAMVAPHVRTVAAYSLDNLGAIEFPPSIARIVVMADRDPPKADGRTPALDALERAIARQQARGKIVQLVLPPPGIKDLNDWLLAGGADPGSASGAGPASVAA